MYTCTPTHPYPHTPTYTHPRTHMPTHRTVTLHTARVLAPLGLDELVPGKLKVFDAGTAGASGDASLSHLRRVVEAKVVVTSHHYTITLQAGGGVCGGVALCCTLRGMLATSTMARPKPCTTLWRRCAQTWLALGQGTRTRVLAVRVCVRVSAHVVEYS